MTSDAFSQDEKRRLRREMKALLTDMEPSLFADAGRLAAERLMARREWREASSVFAFLSMPREIDTEVVCRGALDAGKHLYLPRVQGAALSFRLCGDLSGPWEEGPFGIREPVMSAPPVDFARLHGPSLVVVPALAFDAEGRRLGRGKGYYDRFLRRLRELREDCCAVGIALRCQLVSTVPVGGNDEPVDFVLTD